MNSKHRFGDKKTFFRRFHFAICGIKCAWRQESSFRIHCVATVAIFAFCLWAHPPAIWCALIALLVSAILAAELFNTSLEMLIDVLHPDLHPMIGQAKDCAAGAVFVLSLSSLIVFVALLLELYT